MLTCEEEAGSWIDCGKHLSPDKKYIVFGFQKKII